MEEERGENVENAAPLLLFSSLFSLSSDKRCSRTNSGETNSVQISNSNEMEGNPPRLPHLWENWHASKWGSKF